MSSDENITIPANFTLAFEDNFDDIGGQPNQDNWTFDIGYGQGGWGNGEAQYYTSSTDNSHIVDVIAADASELDTDGTADGVNGALKIIANKTGNEITSARVKSDIDDLGAYGYYEVRAKLPSESGAWPAIWLLGDMTPDRPWPDTGEIDLVEWSSNYFDEVSGNRIISALHFRGAADQPQAHGGTHFKWEGDISSPVDEWHTYQVWWSPDEIKVGVDGNIDNAHLTYTKRPNATNDDWPFDHPMDIIMNIAIGGTLGGTVPAGDFTYEMLVDYVRVYQGDWTTGTGTDTGNDGDDNSGGTGATVYDSNDILHLGNADPGSAAKLTISKTGDDQLTVMMVSADANDPIDVITYGAPGPAKNTDEVSTSPISIGVAGSPPSPSPPVVSSAPPSVPGSTLATWPVSMSPSWAGCISQLPSNDALLHRISKLVVAGMVPAAQLWSM